MLRPLVVVCVIGITVAASCTADPIVTTATDIEAETLGRAIEASIAKGEQMPDDVYAIGIGVDRAAQLVDTHDWRKWFRLRAVARAAKKAKPATVLVDVKQRGGSVEMLRVRKLGAETSVLFHYRTKPGGVGYLDLVIADVDGAARVIDWRTSSTCILGSQQTLETGLDAIDDGETDPVKRLSDGFDAAAGVRKLTDDVKREAWASALADYDALPDRLQRDRAILLLRLAAATHVSQDATVRAKRALRERTSEPECRALLSIDVALADADVTAATHAVDELDQAVGGDPWLAPLRASIARR